LKSFILSTKVILEANTFHNYQNINTLTTSSEHSQVYTYFSLNFEGIHW
jgi:hypothetical protein